MTQPNFLQVQTSLDRACAFVEAHPDLTSSERYGDALREMRVRFMATNRATDATYTEWRKLVGDELTKMREIKLAYEHVLALADEHGYDDAPRRRIVHTEADQLFALVNDTVAWIEKLGGEWGWCEPEATKLTRLVDESVRRTKAADTVRAKYANEVKRRVAAYDSAVALIREFLADARRDASRYEDFAGLTLDVL